MGAVTARIAAPLLAVLGAVGLVVGCTGDDEAAEAPEGGGIAQLLDGVRDDGADPGPLEAPSGEFVEIAVLPSDSRYVARLCAIDFFAPADPDDPVGWLIDQLRSLPSDSAEERAEAEWMIERLERADGLDDPLETDDLSSVASVLRARCSP